MPKPTRFLPLPPDCEGLPLQVRSLLPLAPNKHVACTCPVPVKALPHHTLIRQEARLLPPPPGCEGLPHTTMHKSKHASYPCPLTEKSYHCKRVLVVKGLIQLLLRG